MNNSIEMQIVRLVEEIAKDEKKIVELRNEATETFVDSWRDKYNEQANQVEESLNRKMKLLLILKR